MNVYIAVAIGGAIGAMMRYGVSQYIVDKGVLYPWATVVVNLLGSLLIGFGMAYIEGHPNVSPWVKLLCMTGFLGGLTTFSTFIFEGYMLQEKGLAHMLSYMGGQIILGYGLCWLAFTVGKRMWG
jgi:CrcB-like protein